MLWIFVLVTAVLGGERGNTPAIEFAEPIVVPAGPAGLWDRFGLWTVVAVVLIVVAYAYPLGSLLALERFGSSAFTPF